MSRQASAWMPLYVGDYLKDTSRLTTEQHGAYLLLIMDYWVNGAPPDDDDVLRQIAKAERSAWKRIRAALAPMFHIEDGKWHHKRIDAEITKASDNGERRSSKAQKAAQARWKKPVEDAPSNAPSIPQALLDDCPPPSPIPFTNVNGAETKQSEPEDDEKRALWNDAKAYLGTKRSGQIARWVKDHGMPAVRHALDLAKAENGGAGADDPAAFMAVVLRNGAERLAAQKRADDEQRRAFDRRFPPRDLTEAEASAMMPPAEFEAWRARRRQAETVGSGGDGEAQAA